jgi:serine/threonine-protein kinase HipA
VKGNIQRRIEVWADWAGLEGPRMMGILSAMPARGREIFSFEYDKAWLVHGPAQTLDPALALYQGTQYAAAGKTSFGLFLDSSPDRWGRSLMQRREAQIARKEKREPRYLRESDYLLGVDDGQRMGGLRFRTAPGGPFLADDTTMKSPPWTSLRELEHASLHLERDDAESDPHYSEWLRLLISPGGSLGGARPKAGVVDPEGHLWIAKFPSPRDEADIGGWEYTVHALALRAKLTTSSSAAQKFSSRHHTFLAKRFDRTAGGERRHFASAMTLLGCSDGDDASSGVGYLQIAEFIVRHGAQAAVDLEQLWRRVVFSICVSNVDDHLRNHGFLLGPDGWALSPAYDINPIATADGLKLSVSEYDNAQDLELAKSVAPYFRVVPSRADEIVQEVIGVVRGWRGVAASVGISASEQNRMARAFRIADQFRGH